MLEALARDPDLIRAIRPANEWESGPVPVFVVVGADEAELTFGYSMGAITELTSIRFGDRFANAHDWDRQRGSNPWDAVAELKAGLLESMISSASAQIGSGTEAIPAGRRGRDDRVV